MNYLTTLAAHQVLLVPLEPVHQVKIRPDVSISQDITVLCPLELSSNVWFYFSLSFMYLFDCFLPSDWS